jgi:hypothetical protein
MARVLPMMLLSFHRSLQVRPKEDPSLAAVRAESLVCLWKAPNRMRFRVIVLVATELTGATIKIE